MRDLFFYELRECVAQIRAIEDPLTPSEISQERQIIFDAYDMVCKLAHIARKEGLLSLEEYACTLPKKGSVFNKVVRSACMCIVDGMEPSYVEEIAFNRYMTGIVDGHEGLAVLIGIRGLLLMQENESENVIKEIVQSMIPFELVEE
jgi:hypothetical protein